MRTKKFMIDIKECYRLIYGEIVGSVSGIPVYTEMSSQDYIKLLSLLDHKRSRIRGLAADRLGKIGDRKATPALRNALTDEHWFVRLHSAKALGRIGDDSAIEDLLIAFGDSHASVRRRVATALCRFNTEIVTQALVSALNDSDEYVRERTVESLGIIKSPDTISAISEKVRDPSSNVSWTAAYVLKDIGLPTVDALTKLLSDPSEDVRYRAVKILGYIPDNQAVEAVRSMVSDPAEKVRFRAQMYLRD
jgi:HEAT repeat protein